MKTAEDILNIVTDYVPHDHITDEEIWARIISVIMILDGLY